MYDMVCLPARKKEFKEFSKKEAEIYLKWYISEIDSRIFILKRFAKEDGCKCNFDYSPESLIDLWSWFETKIYTEEKSTKELEEEYKKYPEWMHEFISSTKISIETYKIAWDVSVYFGEVLVRNNSELYYGFFSKPKSRMSVNKPVVLGFKHNMDVDPRQIIKVFSLRDLKESNARALYETYLNWVEDI